MECLFILNALLDSRRAVDDLINNKLSLETIEKSAKAITNAIKNGGRIFSCGNGGSMCDSMHFAEELSGRYRDDRRGLPAVAIADPSYLSCVGNDYGFESIFSRYLEAHAKPGDILVAISTSGKSANIIRAVEYANRNKIIAIVLTGNPDSALSLLASISICTPAGPYADRVQELHIKIIHIIIELIERELFPENYKMLVK